MALCVPSRIKTPYATAVTNAIADASSSSSSSPPPPSPSCVPAVAAQRGDATCLNIVVTRVGTWSDAADRRTRGSHARATNSFGWEGLSNGLRHLKIIAAGYSRRQSANFYFHTRTRARAHAHSEIITPRQLFMSLLGIIISARDV